MDKQMKACARIEYEEDGTLVWREEVAPGALIHLMTLLLPPFCFSAGADSGSPSLVCFVFRLKCAFLVNYFHPKSCITFCSPFGLHTASTTT